MDTCEQFVFVFMFILLHDYTDENKASRYTFRSNTHMRIEIIWRLHTLMYNQYTILSGVDAMRFLTHKWEFISQKVFYDHPIVREFLVSWNSS